MACRGFEEEDGKTIFDYASEVEIGLEEVVAEYHKQYLASDGFDIDVYPKDVFSRMNFAIPLPPHQLANHLDEFTHLSELAIGLYNRNNNTNYKLVKVVKSTMRLCEGFEFRITFEAAEGDATDGDAKIFQASVWNGVEEDVVNFCRLKPTTTN